MTKSSGTVCFFIKENRVLLVEIEYPDGRRVWNGIGGMVDEGETALAAVVREISEETKLKVNEQDLTEATVVPISDFDLHVFTTYSWSGDVAAIDQTLKRFKWFNFDAVPYDQMHPGNDVWLPRVLSSK